MKPQAHATDTGAPDAPGPRRARSWNLALAIFGLLLFGVFVALGTWQVERLAWKRDLIERVDAGVHAAPVAAPGPATWPVVTRADDEYRRVEITGRFEHERETLVQAATVLGAGYWVLTPLRTDAGWRVLVNRGFVPPEARARSARTAVNPDGEVRVTGLLRITEPDGGFLRDNDPAAGRWYSRDVAAISRALALENTAPYFIDQAADAADASAEAAGVQWPAPGLTVIAFRNHHLMYAATWYTLALMVVGGAWLVLRAGRRPDRRAAESID